MQFYYERIMLLSLTCDFLDDYMRLLGNAAEFI